jgi:hypothetical protein
MNSANVVLSIVGRPDWKVANDDRDYNKMRTMLKTYEEAHEDSTVLDEVDSFAALINRKLLIPSNSSGYIAVERPFLHRLMAPLVRQVRVDQDWYMTRYPDVREAVSNGVVGDAREHYVLHGFYEHRFPYEIQVDSVWYLSTYADVDKAIRAKDLRSAQEHFEVTGYREGRLPFANFSLVEKQLPVRHY